MDTSTGSTDASALLAAEYSALIDNALDLMVVHDGAGRILRVNAAARALLGYEPEELAGRHYTDLLDPGQHAEARAIEASLHGDCPERTDVALRVRRKDGSVIQMASAARWSASHRRMFVTARDVTGQQQAREALLRSEAALGSMLESIGDAFFAIDSNWRLTYANRKAAAFVGVDAAESIGKPLLEVAPDLQHSPSLPRYQRAMQTRQADAFEVFWEPGQVWIEARVYPHADGISVYFHEITAKREAEHALKKSEQRFRKLFNQAGDSVMIVDGALRIVSVNDRACARFGYSRDEFLGMLATDVNFGFPEGRALLAGLRAGQAQLLRTDKRCKDGTSFPAEVQISRFDDEGEEYFLAVIRDLSDRAEAERQLRESERRFREVIEMTPAGYLLAGRDGALQDVNPALCALSGYPREMLLALRLDDLFVSCPLPTLDLWDAGPATVQGVEAVLQHRHGYHIHVLFNGSIKRDDEGRALSLTGLMTDITGRKAAENRLQELATHDTLTGLPNRALLGERVQQMLDAAPYGSSVAVMFLDLDRFKEVNDSFGHESGDVLLCEVASRLRKVIRPTDIIARLGGDEFVVAAHCATGQAAAARIADKLLDVLTAPIAVGGIDVIVGASIGISMYPQDAQTRELLFQTADTAMYRAKNSGRNRYRFFEPEMTVATRERMALEVSLRPALARGEFELHYQPRYALDGMALVGMEALIRWNHPERGQVSPQQFIGIAEETGLIVPIGRWVLREACARTRRLMDDYGTRVMVSVNVSARQLAQPGFAAEVCAALADSGLPPACLELELTESALIEDIEHTASMLRELKRLGIRIAVDDFGTGYSGLAYLRRFPIDVLKLDRSFVTQQDENVSTFDFVKAFVDMAHALNMEVVAEGVETQEVCDFLRAARCDQAQGYYLARPMRLGQLRALVGSQPPPKEG
ncbi:EAL domain-containing protein [Massilia sp. IC2-476]|uniref:EAL domain-containing protein n=1 Tax=Massilia sp. IC2-476 TaxID=2887199 RepID=UPI001D11E48D|nr:EAL domain-containing protein [Massilia sp. IC2-476]MCC2973818.1 EAL domain-containing protein [Massilia sp. IC2-476]